jgi:transposase
MLDLEEFLMLRDLFNQGLSISEIARRRGYSRTTVRKYLRSQVPPASKKRSQKPSKLDDYREYIIGRLRDYPLTASAFIARSKREDLRANTQSGRVLALLKIITRMKCKGLI